jgi:hypothetical protein
MRSALYQRKIGDQLFPELRAGSTYSHHSVRLTKRNQQNFRGRKKKSPFLCSLLRLHFRILQDRRWLKAYRCGIAHLNTVPNASYKLTHNFGLFANIKNYESKTFDSYLGLSLQVYKLKRGSFRHFTVFTRQLQKGKMTTKRFMYQHFHFPLCIKKMVFQFSLRGGQ